MNNPWKTLGKAMTEIKAIPNLSGAKINLDNGNYDNILANVFYDFNYVPVATNFFNWYIKGIVPKTENN